MTHSRKLKGMKKSEILKEMNDLEKKSFQKGKWVHENKRFIKLNKEFVRRQPKVKFGVHFVKSKDDD